MVFLCYAAFAAWLSYFYIYLKEVPHLTSVEIGTIAAFQQMNTIFVVPIWGMLADRFGRKRMVLFAVGLTLLIIPLFLVPNTFVWLLAVMILLTLVYNPITSLLDTIALDFEEQSGGMVNYGQIRLWASVGWAVSSLITGYLINSDRLSYIFFIASSILVIAWLIIRLIYKPLIVKRNLAALKLKVIGDLLKAEHSLRWFFLLVFVYSVAAAPIFLIINMYYHEIGAPNKLIGTAFAVQAFSEIPFFFYGKKLVNRFGARRIFLFTMLATGIRMLAYGFTSVPHIAIFIGVIHGISIGLFFVSMVAFVHNIVPAELRSTGQSLIYTFYAGGVCVGNFLTGFFDKFFSMRSMMILNAIIIFVLIAIVLIRKQLLGRKAIL
jgi:oligosaccharide:H+ symporter